MPDVVSPEVRSRMMSGIRSRDTDPELQVRRALHAKGFRFRLHDSSVPGKPDLVLPKYRAAIFVHGCFWHGHDCSLFRLPGTRQDFWSAKIERNRRRDQVVQAAVISAGWRHLTVWECAIKGPHQLGALETASRIEAWLHNERSRVREIRSFAPGAA